MKKLMWIVMVVAVVVVAFETFRPQAPFPSSASSLYLTGALQLLFPGQ